MNLALRTLRDKAREHRWGLVVFLLTFTVYGAIWSNAGGGAYAPASDGYFAYIYARSIVYDGDIEFTNDYKLCGDPQQDIHRIYFSEHPFNGSFVGSSLYFVPAMLLARHFIHLPPDAPASWVNACDGPVTKWTLSVSVLCGALAFWFSYLAACRYVSRGCAAAAAALFAFGSMLTGYATVGSSYTHTYEGFSAAIALWLAVRAEEKPKAWLRWLWAGGYCGVALMMRPNCVVLACIPAMMALSCFWGRWRELAIAWGLVVAGVIVFGMVPLGAVNEFIFNRFSPFAARDKHQIQFGHPHEWLLLFSPIGGLFFFTPAAWLAFFGIPPGLLRDRTRGVTAGFVVCTIPMVYICASILDWHGSNTFGARRLAPLVPIFVVMSAIFMDAAGRWLLARPSRALTALALAVVMPFGMSITGLVSGERMGKGNWFDHALTQEDLYGKASSVMWFWADRGIGDVAVLPAEIVYALRFRRPTSSFRDACRAWYSRHTRLMYWKPNLPALTDAKIRSVEDGLEESGGGMAMTGRRARIVLTTEWPVSTDYTVKASSKAPARLRVGDGHLFGAVWFGEMELPGEGREVTQTFKVPKGELESGMNELLFDSDGGPAAGVVLRSISLDDATPYPPMYPPLRNP